MKKELDMKNIKKALNCYIKMNGYTKSSFARKCDIEYSMLKLFLNEKLSMKKDLEEAILYTILEEEKITLIELLEYIDKDKAFEVYKEEMLNNKINLIMKKEIQREYLYF